MRVRPPSNRTWLIEERLRAVAVPDVSALAADQVRTWALTGPIEKARGSEVSTTAANAMRDPFV